MNRFQRTLTALGNSRFVRFPALTRPMIGSRRFQETFLDSPYQFSNALLQRICDCFEAASRVTSRGNQDVWTELIESNRQFTTAMMARDFDSLRNLFSTLYHGSLLVGMGHTASFIGPKPHYSRDYFSLRCRDSILALAEALALRGVPSNHQTSLDDYIRQTNSDLGSTICGIEADLGYSIEAPAIGRPPVALISTHHINPDFVRHAYVPHRLKQLGADNSAKLIEVGGGFGCVARFAFLAGIRDYTIVDIPHVNAIQMAFLGATLGEDSVSGFCERDAPIRLLPSTQKATAFDRQFDFAVNMDSLPEINLEEAQAYLELIKSNARMFLSINQEAKKVHKGSIAQHSVPELAAAVGGLERLARHPYWMQQGYVEELYGTNPSSRIR